MLETQLGPEPWQGKLILLWVPVVPLPCGGPGKATEGNESPLSTCAGNLGEALGFLL